MTEPGPEVLFDGDCGICREWANYWHGLTGDRIAYRPYQDAIADHPGLDPEECRKAVQFIDADGSRYSGAAATFRLYRNLGPWFLLDALYRRSPAFAAVSEFFYRFFSQRRGLLAALTHFCRGRNFRPAEYHLTSWLFLRALGLIYLAAMLSFAVQAKLLVGEEGISPLAMYLPALKDQLGAGYWYQTPMLFWLNHSDTFIQWLPIAGALLAVAVVFNFATRWALVALYGIYLSLFYGGQVFMTFQWDLLLLEAGVLAILLTSGMRVTVWLYRWLVFRFMFLAGVVKLMSGDETWRHLTALNYHFETQPLPSPLAWYAAKLPEWILKTGTAGTVGIELVLPFLVFAPRRLRMFAAWGFILLQVLIMLTGSYNFFNLLVIALCLMLFDDAALSRLVPQFVIARFVKSTPRPRPVTGGFVWLVALVIFVSSSDLVANAFSRGRLGYMWLTRTIAPCQCVNNYGPFAVMTRQRYEIIVEGSDDGIHWRPYDFWYKPGDLARRPAWIIPHQPRVDWQMWFAALGQASDNAWFSNLLVRILQGDKSVAPLFRVNPFPDNPPEWVRARFFLYHFTSVEQREETGDWWDRRLVGDYYPPIHLRHTPSPVR